ncbi:MAG TPA: hypothetical protein VFR76_02475 [Verrucomicrobiae bacterium]|nr:hypothetical protein [Verrucomicrobiae bacterium]
MKATKLLHEFGQSLWLDNITRDLLNEGLADRLQEEGAAAFVKSWNELLAVLESKCTALRQAA